MYYTSLQLSIPHDLSTMTFSRQDLESTGWEYVICDCFVKRVYTRI